MTTFPVEEDGWLVEVVEDVCKPHDTTTRHCKRCRKDQPIENFTRPVSEKQALFLARKEGLAETTDEYYSRAAIHKSVSMAHRLCNTCAAKLRKVKKQTADELDAHLRMLKRFERHVHNPYYISPLRTPREPLTITERELKVRMYRETQNARKVDGKRRADKERKGKVYAAYMKEIRNEIQRIGVRVQSKKVAEDEVLAAFYDDYLNHLRGLRWEIREERFSFSPVEPKGSAFQYISKDNPNTARALRSLGRLDTATIERLNLKFLPMYEILDARYREQEENLAGTWE